MKKYPRVLVINGEPFNSVTATGITIENLFRDWPVDKIAMIYTANIPPSFEVCQNMWKLDPSDMLIPRSDGRVSPIERTALQESGNYCSSSNKSTFSKKIKSSVVPLLEFVSYKVSQGLNSWIEEFKPDLIYSTLGSIRLVTLVDNISNTFAVPVVPHFMDDWINTYSVPGKSLATWFHKNIIKNKTKSILGRGQVGLAIGDLMASEYSKKYGGDFFSFMNPVVVDGFFERNYFDSKHCRNKFVYVGGVHLGRVDNLLLLAMVISDLCMRDIDVCLDIYVPVNDIYLLAEISSLVGVRVCNSLKPEDVKGVLATYDFAVHVESFLASNMDYTRLSVSTKIPQYFSEGLPVFAFGPEQLASCQYVNASKAGVCISSLDYDFLRESVMSFILNRDALNSFSINGYRTALLRHKNETERERFVNILFAVANA